jgi:Family of unknown function (DUF5681)
MSENEQERQVAQSVVDAPGAPTIGAGGEDKGAPSEYKVGKYRPPVEKQYRPGQSGNPKGRPRGRRNTKTIIERVLEEPVSVRLGEKTRTLPMVEAILYALAARAVQGDVRSAEFVFDLAGDFMDSVAGAGQETAEQQQLRVSRPPSAELFANIDEALLSDDDKIDLSRFQEIVDLGGGMTALNVNDFARAREIVNKGRGKDITSSTQPFK